MSAKMHFLDWNSGRYIIVSIKKKIPRIKIDDSYKYAYFNQPN